MQEAVDQALAVGVIGLHPVQPAAGHQRQATGRRMQLWRAAHRTQLRALKRITVRNAPW
ncbi:hypothetical protein [Streptomyces sp. NPDC047043]|uniref:hypothetical protein n=1 Tax=Streptomyces sp. NPDC047043 TaxID=3154497 RepID=UPI0033E6ECDF